MFCCELVYIDGLNRSHIIAKWLKYDRPGDCSPKKDFLIWHWLTFRQPFVDCQLSLVVIGCEDCTQWLVRFNPSFVSLMSACVLLVKFGGQSVVCLLLMSAISRLIYFICIIHLHIFHGNIWTQNWPAPNVSGFIAQLVERRTGIARSRVQAPLKSWIFFRLLYSLFFFILHLKSLLLYFAN